MSRRLGYAIGWGTAGVLLLLASATPLVIATVHLLMVPPVMLAARLTPKGFAGSFAAVVAVAYGLPAAAGMPEWGMVLAVPAIFFLIPSVLMGTMYRRKTAAFTTVAAAAIALLAQWLVIFVGLYAAGINVVAELEQFLRESIREAVRFWGLRVEDGETEQIVRMFSRAIPLMLIGFSVYYAALTHAVARRLLALHGETVPGMPPVRDWMLPKSLVWVYVVVLLADMFTRPQPDSALAAVLANVLPILQFAFSVQGVSFLSFWMHHARGRGRVTAITAFVLVLLFPPATVLASLLGVFDVAFPLRERVRRR